MTPPMDSQQMQSIAATELLYPDSDGKPMGETGIMLKRFYICTVLCWASSTSASEMMSTWQRICSSTPQKAIHKHSERKQPKLRPPDCAPYSKNFNESRSRQ